MAALPQVMVCAPAAAAKPSEAAAMRSGVLRSSVEMLPVRMW